MTSDRVKWDRNGELVFLGRFNHQVKVRGCRMELGEIETALEKQDGVRDAIVMARDDRLVAFVSSSSDMMNEDTIKASQEKVAREDLETKHRKLQKKVKQYEQKNHLSGSERPALAPPTPQPPMASTISNGNKQNGKNYDHQNDGVAKHVPVEPHGDVECTKQCYSQENVPKSCQSKSGVGGKTSMTPAVRSGGDILGIFGTCCATSTWYPGNW